MVLRLLTSKGNPVAELVDDQAEVIDLTRDDVDYGEVLRKIFESESIQVF